MKREVCLTDTKEVVLPRGVWLNASIKVDPDKTWDPELITYEITLTSRAESEYAALTALTDANEEITEAFDYPVPQ